VHLSPGCLDEDALAGLGHLSSAACAILVHRVRGDLRLEVWGVGHLVGPAVDGDIWLRTDLDYRNFASFSYSTDGDAFTALGGSSPTVWSCYRGSRIALYSFSAGGAGGHALFRDFQYVVPSRDLPWGPEEPGSSGYPAPVGL
jgi:hypothetical protein